ncbi:hypothetical protein HPB50_009208 [Hyalomma asiaticum]|uniref:Uncharacterized protein n=1 Tax=Hyalomma asiaticum TaxID=266040 RepID=A0ACB7RTR0_HYAAI|nr:hypothetical protein HPB50_009208 [Hyalomma asiaticum]
MHHAIWMRQKEEHKRVFPDLANIPFTEQIKRKTRETRPPAQSSGLFRLEGGDLDAEWRRCGVALLLLERERLRGLSERLFRRGGDLDADRERERDLERERERESEVERRDLERERERDLERDLQKRERFYVNKWPWLPKCTLHSL